MKYARIVQYVKENHVSWDTDIFDILKDYTESLLPPIEGNEIGKDRAVLSANQGPEQSLPIYSSLLEVEDSCQIPPNGEYTFEDLIELFSK